MSQAETPSKAKSEQLLSLFNLLSHKLFDLNVKSSSILKDLIKHNHASPNDPSPQDVMKIDEDEYGKLLQEASELNSAISTLEATVNRTISEFLPSKVVVPTEVEKHVNPTPEEKTVIRGTPRLLDSFQAIILKHISPSLITLGGGVIDPNYSHLNKYAESLVVYKPSEITEWPDGWYNATSSQTTELLLTIDRGEFAKDAFVSSDPNPLRFLIVFNKALKSIETDQLFSFRISDRDAWLSEELFSSSVTKHMKFGLLQKLMQLTILTKQKHQEDPNNTANRLTA